MVELSEGGSWVPEWLHETNSFCSSINHIGLQCEQGTPLPCLGLRFCSCLLQQSEYSYKYTYREGILGEKYLTLSGVPGNMVPRWTLPREINWSCISPSPKGPKKQIRSLDVTSEDTFLSGPFAGLCFPLPWIITSASYFQLWVVNDDGGTWTGWIVKAVTKRRRFFNISEGLLLWAWLEILHCLIL